MPSLSAVTGTPSSPGPSAPLGSGIDTGPADIASQTGNAEEGVAHCPVLWRLTCV